MITGYASQMGLAALPALAALWGGWYGARRAIDKTREDRALDRRLEWHERVFRSIASIRVHMSMVRISLRKTGAIAPELAVAIVSISHDLDVVLAERFLYATVTSLPAIEELLNEMNRFDKGNHHMTNPAALEDFDRVAAMVLLPVANAMRATLRWPLLPEDGSVSIQHLGTDTPERPAINPRIVNSPSS